ncbi:MAG: hypothetical protein UY21_C0009G0001 [Microgenomates group bacterium GW2011_GWA1_48_10]|nr:MAG: hypothetical protein UY21_C0009G0001 [Microgenomates group bacterium GW2011_GWA1_48_10]
MDFSIFSVNLAIALSLSAIALVLTYALLIRPDQKKTKKSAKV